MLGAGALATGEAPWATSGVAAARAAGIAVGLVDVPWLAGGGDGGDDHVLLTVFVEVARDDGAECVADWEGGGQGCGEGAVPVVQVDIDPFAEMSIRKRASRCTARISVRWLYRMQVSPHHMRPSTTLESE